MFKTQMDMALNNLF